MIDAETPTGDDSLATQIRKLNVQADDTLVVELPENYDADDKAVVEYVRRDVREQTKQPDLGVLVVPHGTRLTILAKAATISDKLAQMTPRVAVMPPGCEYKPIVDTSKLAALLDELDEKLDAFIADQSIPRAARSEMIGMRCKIVCALTELREGEGKRGLTSYISGVTAAWTPEVTEDPPAPATEPVPAAKMFDEQTRKDLEAAGFRIGDAEDFLAASDGAIQDYSQKGADPVDKASADIQPYRNLLPESVRYQERPNPKQSWGGFIAEARWQEDIIGSVFLWVPETNPPEAYVLSTGSLLATTDGYNYKTSDMGAGVFVRIPASQVIHHVGNDVSTTDFDAPPAPATDPPVEPDHTVTWREFL